MRRRSDLPRLLAAAALTASVGLAAEAASGPLRDGAWPCQSPDDDDPVRVEAEVRAWAEAGHVGAMERLGLMHWHGQALYGPGPWQRDVALRWFERASSQGSAVGVYMLGVADRGRAR